MNMTIAELLAFDVAPADASLHIELSKDEHTQYSTLSSARCPTSSCSTQGRPMESSDPTRGEAGVGVSNTEEGRSTAHSCVLKGLVQSMGPSRCEDMAGTTRSFRWTRGDQMDRALTTHEDPEEYGALAQRYPHFGSLDGGAVTTTTTSEIGSLVCFDLKRGMHSISCDQTAYGEEQSDNKPLQPRHARLVGFTLKCRRHRVIRPVNDYISFNLGPYLMLPGRAPNQHKRTCRAKICRPSEPAQMPPRKQGAQLQQKGSLTTKQRASQPSKEGLFEAWSHAQHQPKRRAPQATFNRPPRARKRSERVFEDF
ncbi:BQ5605_C029g10695 [Microbotryum silenes-dioicae]|uniref:BQ5605_C029g10695 protein n=1 Tax=Microbotryum silenes-dioicae TaxID=796604 RepID=A0A2X0N5A9_9BASI|nr:BQ5605_C029g10695 [Microbotryum silenes-dioicae]